MRSWKRILPLLLALALLAGCGQSAQVPDNGAGSDDEEIYIDLVPMGDLLLDDESVALAAAPAPVALYDLLLPEASGTATKKNDRAVIDYSNTADGYVMVKFTGTTKTRLKVQVFGPTTSDPYKYNLTPGEWTTFPLSDGNGEYKVTVYEQNTDNSKYATVLSATFTAQLKDEFAPFLRPNQYVDYADQENTLAKAAELTEGLDDPLDMVKAVYNYVVKNLTYDKVKAETVQSGYLPVLDDVLAEKKGICFDYAALMAGMLRAQGVPTKLVTGFVPSGQKTLYHAWISVWTEETGWIDGVIYFDGETWQRMDPTFASSGNSSSKIMKYIGDGSNYSIKCLY